MSTFETILLISGLAYSAFIGWCLWGWNRIPEFNSGAPGNPGYFTVIIPARNEAASILTCLESMRCQEYAADRFEVLVVDDQSTDGTAGLVQTFLAAHPGFPGRILTMNTSLGEAAPYKKRAIEAAVAQAKGSWILSTDADCMLPPRWLQTLAAFREQYGPVFLSAPVMLSGENSLLEKFQSLEFTGLVGIGAASIGMESPMMCNGANMGYDKDIFLNTGGYGNHPTASGDDTQLLRNFSKQTPGKVMFVKSRNACVLTTGQKSLGNLMQQRIRWSSKIPLHMRTSTILVAANAYLLHACLFAGFFLPTPVWLAVWLIKSVVEFMFLFVLTRFFGNRSLLNYFPLAQLVYPLYITVTGLLAMRGTYRWKGRKQTVHA